MVETCNNDMKLVWNNQKIIDTFDTYQSQA